MSIASDQAVVIWGEILWDRFPDGDQLGGAPANVAWHLGQAGGWAQLVSRVGDDDDGRRAVARLAALCDTSLVQIDRERATGEVEVRIEHGEPRYRLVPDRAWERIACTPDVELALADAGVMVYGTLSQRTQAGLAGWRAAIAATRAGCIKVCDINLRRRTTTPRGERAPGVEADDVAHELAVAREAIAAADVVKVNDRELDVLAAWFGWRDPIAALRDGRKVVTITHGAAGSTLYGEARPIEVPAVPAASGGDNVGCGDAYLALLVHGMTLGWDLAASGRAASRWAAAVAGHRGATPVFDDEHIDAMLDAEVAA